MIKQIYNTKKHKKNWIWTFFSEPLLNLHLNQSAEECYCQIATVRSMWKAPTPEAFGHVIRTGRGVCRCLSAITIMRLCLSGLYHTGPHKCQEQMLEPTIWTKESQLLILKRSIPRQRAFQYPQQKRTVVSANGRSHLTSRTCASHHLGSNHKHAIPSHQTHENLLRGLRVRTSKCSHTDTLSSPLTSSQLTSFHVFSSWGNPLPPPKKGWRLSTFPGYASGRKRPPQRTASADPGIGHARPAGGVRLVEQAGRTLAQVAKEQLPTAAQVGVTPKFETDCSV